MGLLDDATGSDEGEAATDEPAGQEPAAAVEPAGPDVIVKPAAPRGRRAQAAAELTEVKTMLGDIGKQFGEYRTAKDQELAQLRGELSAYAQRQPQVVYQQPPQPQQQAPDIGTLRREAKKALDAGDFDRYQELTEEGASYRAEARMAPRLQQQQGPQGPHPLQSAMVPLFAAHPEVAKHPRHMALLNAKAAELLEGRGMQPGPETLALVFAEVDAALHGSRKANGSAGPTYSRAAAAAITGAPTNRVSATPADGPTVNLSEIARKAGTTVESMKRWASKAGMSMEEYAALLPGR